MRTSAGVLAVAAALTALVPARGAAQVARGMGQVVDASTGQAVAGAVIDWPGRDARDVTDAEGRFHLPQLPEGRHAIRVTHIAYGTHQDTLEVGTVAPFLAIRISPRAIALEPLFVEAPARERTETSRAYVVTRDQIEAMLGRVRHLGEILRSYIPGASVSELRAGYLCVEFRGARGARTRGCNYPLVVVDNVPIPSPGQYLRDTPPAEVERIEFIPASAGAGRYGVDSQYGVLVIETRRSGAVGQAAARPTERPAPRFPSYQWEREPNGHPWERTVAGAAVGNALGVAAGLAVMGCFGGTDRPSCTRGHSAGLGVVALALPVLGATTGARLFGATEGSHGRLLHAAIAATLPILIGYATYHDGEVSGVGSSRWLGGALILVGTPVAVTLSDGLFRRAREPIPDH